jgi:lipopolysaccharide/colanic/teichoic acid biosynthesis glycosyltransferase
VLVSPVLLLTIIVMKLANPKEPVFFSQIRLTRYDQKFKIFKLRSQYSKFDGTTPEQAFEKLGRPELSLQYRENGDHLPKDPRILRFGNLIRSLSIDELPQLYNVFRGDLSLVGPRALIPEELNAYGGRHKILSVKSGLTGLAIISGRRDIPFEERRKLDIYYVQNWSFWLDIVIIIKTLVLLLRRIGAK